MAMIAHVWWDGGARPTNPGHAGFAVYVRLDDAVTETTISRYLGPKKTNNYAEYVGLIVAIKVAIRLGADEIVMTGDSKLVIEQVSGNWQCKNNDLKPLCRTAQQLLERNFKDAWEFIHVRGHQAEYSENSYVDEMCTEAIKYGMIEHHNANPFNVKAHGKKPIEGKIIEDYGHGPLVLGEYTREGY
jgi:ribonuclease HI